MDRLPGTALRCAGRVGRRRQSVPGDAAGHPPSMPDDKYLRIHLNDHLAGAVSALELAKRVQAATEGTELGAFMRGLVAELAEDRRSLRELMALAGAEPDRLKVAGGWVGEKIGRLKPNGELRSTSPLSRVVELEGLSLAIEGKRLLWVVLLDVQPERFGAARLRELITRAERQRAGIEERLRAAAREPFGMAVPSREAP